MQDIDKGFICPCCNQFVKRYTRKLNSSMAYTLFLIYQSDKRGFFHVENWLKEIGKPQLRADYHKLRFWKFLEKKLEAREDGSNRNGFYKITGLGIMFCEEKILAYEKVLIFNNEFQGFSGKEITIRKALNEKFDYDKLMGEHLLKAIVPRGTTTGKEKLQLPQQPEFNF